MSDRALSSAPVTAREPRPFFIAHWRWLLLAIAAAAFALRIGVAAKFQGLSAPPDAESNPDQLDYELFAWRLACGEGYTLSDGTPTARRPPGTSMTLLPIYALFGRDYAAARVWFAAISAGSCLLSGLIAFELFGAIAALLAALAVALLPGHFYYSMHFLSEVPYGFFIALTCWFGIRLLRRVDDKRPWVAASLATGLCFGAALLTRPQVAFAGLVVLVGALLSPQVRRMARLRAVVVVGLASTLLLVPWVVRNQQQLGKATLSTIGGFTFWGANNALLAADPELVGSWMPIEPLIDADHPLDGTELENDAACWRYGVDYLKQHQGDLPRLLAMKVVRHFSAFRTTTNRAVYWSFAASWLVVGPLALLGLLWCWWRRRAALVVVLAPVASTLLTALLFYGSIRFRDADAALYVVPAAALLASWLPARWQVSRDEASAS